MKQNNSKFVENFEKIAAAGMPKWLQNAHKTMAHGSVKQHSKHGLKKMMKHRGIK